MALVAASGTDQKRSSDTLATGAAVAPGMFGDTAPHPAVRDRTLSGADGAVTATLGSRTSGPSKETNHEPRSRPASSRTRCLFGLSLRQRADRHDRLDEPAPG